MYKLVLRTVSSLSILALLSSKAIAGSVNINSSPAAYGIGDNVIVFNIEVIPDIDSLGYAEEILDFDIKKPGAPGFESLTNCTNIGLNQFNCSYTHTISDAERGAPIEITVKADFTDSNFQNITVASRTKSVGPSDAPVAVINASNTTIYNNQLNAPTAVATHLNASDSYDGQGGSLTYEWRESGTSYYSSSNLPPQYVISIPAPKVISPPETVNIELVVTDSDGNISVPAIQSLNVVPNACSYWDNTTFKSLLKFTATSGNVVNMALDDAYLFSLMSTNLANFTSINPNTVGLSDIVSVQGLIPGGGFAATIDPTGQTLKNAGFPFNDIAPTDLTGALTIDQIYTIKSEVSLQNSASQRIMNPANCTKAEISFRVPPYSFSQDLQRPIEFLQNGVVIDTIRIPFNSGTSNIDHSGAVLKPLVLGTAQPQLTTGLVTKPNLTIPNTTSQQVITSPSAITRRPIGVVRPKTLPKTAPIKAPQKRPVPAGKEK